MSSKQTRRLPVTRELALILLTDILTSLAMNLTNSLWPLYIQSLGATVMQVSLVITITGLAGTLMRAPSGLISDLYGRRKIIILSILLSTFPPLLYTFSKSWGQLMPWGIIYNIAFSLYMPSRIAVVADYTPIEYRTRAYSIMNLAGPLGGILGPTMGGLLQNFYGWNSIFYTATALYASALIPVLLLPKPQKNPEDNVESLDDTKRIDLAFIRQLLPFFLFDLCIGMGIGTVSMITPIYLTDKFKISTVEVGIFISISFGLMMFLSQIPGGILADRFGRKRIITASATLLPVLSIIWTMADNFILLLLIQMAINSLWSMTWPAILSLFMERTPRNRRGIAQGITQTCTTFGFTIGPSVGGYMWETYGKVFPYYTSAFFLLFCIPVILMVKEKSST